MVDFGGDLDRIYVVVKEIGVMLKKILLIYVYIDYVGVIVDLLDEYILFIVGFYIGDDYWIKGLLE